MTMQDILKALMQSAGSQQQLQQSGDGGDAMSQVLGGLLGGSQQGGGDALSQVISGLLGGSQQGGGAPATQLLGGLEQIIGAQSGAAAGAATSTSDPLMALIQPLVNKLAAKVNISPAIATIIVSIVLKYLLKSHPSTPDESPLDLGSVMQTLASGGRISESTLQNSGMVNDVVRATGLDQQQAVKTLDTTFKVLGSEVKGVRGKATLKRKRE
ncbi:MAG: hypothetical protein V1755_15585 [Chloroflexota bacterium]